MSQITRLTTAGMIGAVVALEGNTGGPVGPDISGIIDVVGDGVDVTVSGNPATNTLTISLLNEATFNVTTTDATPTPIFSRVLGANEAVGISVNMIAAQSTWAAGLWGTGNAAAIRAGAGAVLLKAPIINISDNFAGAPIFEIVIVANAITVNVIGLAATTINWQAQININILT